MLSWNAQWIICDHGSFSFSSRLGRDLCFAAAAESGSMGFKWVWSSGRMLFFETFENQTHDVLALSRLSLLGSFVE